MTNFDQNTVIWLLATLIALLPITGMLMALMPHLMPRRECFAVTVPNTSINDPYLKKMKRTYSTWMIALTVFATAASVLALAISEGVFLITFTIAITTICAVGYGLMLHFRSMVIQYKKQQGWKAESVRTVGFVGDTAFPKPISFAWNLLYLPIIAITAAIGVIGYPSMPDQIPLQISFSGEVTTWADKSPLIVVFPMLFVLFIAGCFMLSQWSIIRSKQGIDPARPATSRWAYGMFARAQSIFCVAAGLLVSLIGPLMQLANTGAIELAQTLPPIMLVVLIITVAATAISLIYGQNGSHLISRLETRDEENLMSHDNDEHWKLGIFYVNPDDASLFLPERFGIGWTINLGRPVAWVIIGAFVLVTAAFIVVSITLA